MYLLPKLAWIAISGNVGLRSTTVPTALTIPIVSSNDILLNEQDEILGQGASGKVVKGIWNIKKKYLCHNQFKSKNVQKNVAVKLFHGITSDGTALDEVKLQGHVGSGIGYGKKYLVTAIGLMKDNVNNVNNINNDNPKQTVCSVCRLELSLKDVICPACAFPVDDTNVNNQDKHEDASVGSKIVMIATQKHLPRGTRATIIEDRNRTHWLINVTDGPSVGGKYQYFPYTVQKNQEGQKWEIILPLGESQSKDLSEESDGKDSSTNQKVGVVMEILPEHLTDLALPPTIEEVIEDRYNATERFGLTFVMQVLHGVASALCYLHDVCKVSHGDVYAHNIVVDRNNGTQVRLLDLGAASYYEEDECMDEELVEKVEVRAFGILAQELLQRVSVVHKNGDSHREESAVLNWMYELVDNCIGEHVRLRPFFNEILYRIKEIESLCTGSTRTSEWTPSAAAKEHVPSFNANSKEYVPSSSNANPKEYVPSSLNTNSIPFNAAASKAKSFALKFLVSSLYSGSVLGKAGSNIRMFQAESKTRMKVSQKDSYFPCTDYYVPSHDMRTGTNRDRIILVQGKKYNIVKGIGLILRCISDEHEGYTSNGVLTFRLLIPELVCDLFNERNGTTVQEIYTYSGARIRLNDRQFSDLYERVLTMSGTMEEILHATSLVLQKLSEDEKCSSFVNEKYATMNRMWRNYCTMGLVTDYKCVSSTGCTENKKNRKTGNGGGRKN